MILRPLYVKNNAMVNKIQGEMCIHAKYFGKRQIWLRTTTDKLVTSSCIIYSYYVLHSVHCIFSGNMESFSPTEGKWVKCGWCGFKTTDIISFIPHYRMYHENDILVIYIPYLDNETKKRLYSVMNYQKSLKDFGIKWSLKDSWKPRFSKI